MTPSNTIDISRVRMSLPDLAATTVLRPPGDIERARRADPPYASMSVRLRENGALMHRSGAAALRLT
jgi:hypothetical protein